LTVADPGEGFWLTKFRPEIVIVSPVLAVAGAIPVITGATTNEYGKDVWLTTVIVKFPVRAFTGTGTVIDVSLHAVGNPGVPLKEMELLP
jgi:hypothetical protein